MTDLQTIEDAAESLSDWVVFVHLGGKDLQRLSMRGVLLMVLTLGLYRFWFVSDLRRFFWSRTLIDDSPLEYSGRGLELFIGFLIAVAILLPLAIALFGLSLISPQTLVLGNTLYFILLSFLGQYALFRARRYRLNRTIWRGLRLHLTGSAWKYAFMWMGWIIVSILTLGLAWPWASASLERYRVNHTWYGNLQLRSDARWSDIMKPFAVIWLILVLPVVVTVFTGILISAGASSNAGFGLYSNAATLLPLILLLLALIPVVGLLIYPWYKAVIMRTYFSKISAGAATLKAGFTTGLIYRIWFKTAAFMVGASIALSIVGGIVYLILEQALPKEIIGDQVFNAVIAIIAYVAWIAVNYVITITVYNFGIWHFAGNSMTIANPGIIHEARAGMRDEVGGINEGFADALDVGGGFEIGL